MELEGFNTSLQGTTFAIVVDREEEVWIPWECLPQEGIYILLCGKEGRTHKVLQHSYSWNLVWSPTTSKEWSMLATVLKAMTGPIMLVLDLGAPIPPFAFTEFLETLPMLTKIQIATPGTSLGVFGHPTSILWSDSISLESRMEAIRTVSMEAITAATNAVKDSNVQLLASNLEGSWKLYWIRSADSWALVKRLDESARCSLRTGMLLLEKV
jgi:hypothetical protein